MNSIDQCRVRNYVDINGDPAGGYVIGTGFSVEWQDGPLGSGDNRKEPNGAFVETIISTARSRLLFYQNSKYACDENQQALELLDKALEVLDARTKARMKRGVEGLNVV